ncbi:MAG TPA: hypothetical protein VFP80_15675 [Thermoanaerobaculia bacterium]|nr:hypothetical protein [Thermoanaerobaculia bacterium]
MELHGIRFRSNPRVELKRLADLDETQRERFRELELDPEFYGLLVPRPPLAMSVKSVGRPAAELFRTLAAPAHLDAELLADDEEAGDVVGLVLDGVLEIESGGAFVSGAAAAPLLCGPLRVPEVRDAVARLSREALLHAQDLETGDPQALMVSLYLYNRLPVTPSWRARFPGGDAVLAHLGADRGSLRALLEQDWVASAAPGWLRWSSRAALPRDEREGTYKLYISPRPERIREVFTVAVRVLSSLAGVQLKVGDDACGLLRPDKLVAHFPARAHLDHAAAGLRRELAGCDAHGVPFTAGLDADGLLSWGVDPPDHEYALRWVPKESWRLWLARHLAAALAVAKAGRQSAGVEPWLFALDRVRRHGVDIETWTPSAAIWSRP